MNNLKLDLIKFLRLVEETFPYTTMSEGFRGKHNITLTGDKLILGVWYKSRIYHIELEDNDFEDMQQTLLNIKEFYINK